MKGFRWTARKEETALLIAQDELTDREIAKRSGLSVQGLAKWKRTPQFRERVEELVAAVAESVKGRGIAERQNRVDELNQEWDRLRSLRDARAREYAHVPGGDTGLLVRQVKLVKVGGRGERETGRGGDEGTGRMGAGAERGFVEIEEYVLDTGLLRELREHAKQAAQELGQWNEDRQDGSAVLVREYVGVVLEGL